MQDVEDQFKEFTNRDDIAVILINQHIAEMIRFTVDNYRKSIPAVLEIPSKDHPYEASKVIRLAYYLLFWQVFPRKK